ncbi:hypothetical protein D3C74_403950 [compost metagenome]
MSSVYRSVRFGYPSQSQMRLQVSPRSVLRQITMSGHHETWLTTMRVSGSCRSIVRPEYP